MLRMTSEYSPYGTMLDLLLLEAEEMESDQILLISRSARTSLYFVSHNRVQKSMEFELDFTTDLLDHLSRTSTAKSSVKEPNAIQVKFNQGTTGRCVSLIIQKDETADDEQQNIDSTIKIPPIDFR